MRRRGAGRGKGRWAVHSTRMPTHEDGTESGTRTHQVPNGSACRTTNPGAGRHWSGTRGRGDRQRPSGRIGQAAGPLSPRRWSGRSTHELSRRLRGAGATSPGSTGRTRRTLPPGRPHDRCARRLRSPERRGVAMLDLLRAGGGRGATGSSRCSPRRRSGMTRSLRPRSSTPIRTAGDCTGATAGAKPAAGHSTLPCGPPRDCRIARS
jgi:hypothetical protein